LAHENIPAPVERHTLRAAPGRETENRFHLSCGQMRTADRTGLFSGAMDTAREDQNNHRQERCVEAWLHATPLSSLRVTRPECLNRV
jgi:hypothetical protein